MQLNELAGGRTKGELQQHLSPSKPDIPSRTPYTKGKPTRATKPRQQAPKTTAPKSAGRPIKPKIVGKTKIKAPLDIADFKGDDKGKYKEGDASVKGMHRLTQDDLNTLAKYSISITPEYTDHWVIDDFEERVASGDAVVLIRQYNTSKPPKAAPIFSGRKVMQSDAAKYHLVRLLESKIPKIAKDLALRSHKPGPEGDVAAVLLLMLHTGIRPDGGGRVGVVYGGSSLEAHHVKVSGNKTTMSFVGKGEKNLVITTTDPGIAAMMKARLKGKKPGEQMFPGASATKMRVMMREVAGPQFIPYNFRHRIATSIAVREIAKESGYKPIDADDFKAHQKAITALVSAQLGNRPEQTLKSYIAPSVWLKWNGVREEWVMPTTWQVAGKKPKDFADTLRKT